MKILVDIGNSRLKWATCTEQEFTIGGATPYSLDTFEDTLTTLWRNIPIPQQILVANVAGQALAEKLSQWTEQIWQQTPFFAVTPKQAGNIINAYRETHQLGIDRWLGMMAARYEFSGPLLIIQCGTCITADIIDAEGQHRGGFIAPGLTLLQNAIIERVSACTNLVTHVEITELTPADNTQQAIERGSLLMTLGFIDRLQLQATKELKREPIGIISGGHAELLLPLLSTHYHYRPHLVLEGLKNIQLQLT